jgi:hypothetical protein
MEVVCLLGIFTYAGNSGFLSCRDKHDEITLIWKGHLQNGASDESNYVLFRNLQHCHRQNVKAFLYGKRNYAGILYLTTYKDKCIYLNVNCRQLQAYLLKAILIRRSQWLHSLRHEMSLPAWILGSWVRIPLEAWMYAFILCLCCPV